MGPMVCSLMIQIESEMTNPVCFDKCTPQTPLWLKSHNAVCHVTWQNKSKFVMSSELGDLRHSQSQSKAAFRLKTALRLKKENVCVGEKMKYYPGSWVWSIILSSLTSIQLSIFHASQGVVAQAEPGILEHFWILFCDLSPFSSRTKLCELWNLKPTLIRIYSLTQFSSTHGWTPGATAPSIYSNITIPVIIQSPVWLMMVIIFRCYDILRITAEGGYRCAFFPQPDRGSVSPPAGPDPQRLALNRVLDLWATLQEGPGDAALLVLRYWIPAA